MSSPRHLPRTGTVARFLPFSCGWRSTITWPARRKGGNGMAAHRQVFPGRPQPSHIRRLRVGAGSSVADECNCDADDRSGRAVVACMDSPNVCCCPVDMGRGERASLKRCTSMHLNNIYDVRRWYRTRQSVFSAFFCLFRLHRRLFKRLIMSFVNPTHAFSFF